jgi:hypothetical protein
MRFCSLCIVQLCVVSLSWGQRLPLEQFGAPFSAGGVDVTWTATNIIPTTMTVYRVRPLKLTSLGLSNVIAIGEFREPEKILRTLGPALKGKTAYYEEAETRKWLSISPESGRIAYMNRSVVALPGQSARGVPNDDQTVQLALSILRRLGADEAQVARKPGGDSLLFWRDKQVHGSKEKVTGRTVRREIANGVYLIRATNDISFAGTGHFGGLFVQFGSDAKIAEFDFCWRNLEVTRTVQVASPDEIVRSVKSGKSFIAQDDETLREIRNVTITNAIPHYFGQSSLEQQEFVYPFVTLEGFTKSADKKIPVVLACPIVK